MNNVFILLFSISLVALIAGLISPSLYSFLFGAPPSRNKIGVIFGLLALIFFALTSMTGQQKTLFKKPTPTLPAIRQAYDVQSLIGKDAYQIKSEYSQYMTKGSEASPQQIQEGAKEWDMEFKKDGKTFSVTYDISTRKVIGFFLETDDPSGKTTDKARLLKLGNLSETDPNYTVLYVPTEDDPNEFVGVRVLLK